MICTRGAQLLKPVVGLPLQHLLDAAQAYLHVPFEVVGDRTRVIARLAPLQANNVAGSSPTASLSYCYSAAMLPSLRVSKAAAVITHASLQGEVPEGITRIITPHPQLFYAQLSQWWRSKSEPFRVAAGGSIHPSAIVDVTARIDPSAVIGPLCVIESGASVGARSRLHAQVCVGYDCVIGDDCTLYSGVVIGADGFGYVNTHNVSDGEWIAVAQLGAVRIGDRVDIGANSCIDRGALEDTVLEDGVKLDNLVHIAHNVRIGRNSALAGQVGVAGSARIGAQSMIGGASALAGHITLADRVHIGGATTVIKSLTKPGLYTGVYPMQEHADWEKNAALLRQLGKLRERIRRLERRQDARQADTDTNHAVAS